MYNINSFIKNHISIPISMLLGIVIWEIPNIYSKDWIYTIPYITYEIFHINLVVILGWILLILGPVYIYKILLPKPILTI